MTDQATTHRVWRVGADIDTDALAPGAYMKFGIDEIARHCLQRVRPEFAAQARPGDVLVAGPNFGIGSSREQAAAALVRLGIAAVIAPSFNGLYFRNAFNVGLLLLTCGQAETWPKASAFPWTPPPVASSAPRPKARRSNARRCRPSCWKWCRPADC